MGLRDNDRHEKRRHHNAMVEPHGFPAAAVAAEVVALAEQRILQRRPLVLGQQRAPVGIRTSWSSI